MKKLVVFLIIISIFVSLTVFVTFATNFNRYSSYVMKEINSSYGPFYSLPTILSIDRTGSDYEGPLYSTASTWKGYTDDGYDGYFSNGSFAFPEGIQEALTHALSSGQYFMENLAFDTWWSDYHNERLCTYGAKNYIKKFVVSAYAYISCSTSYERYKTTVNKLRVKVPAWLTISEPVGSSNERNPHAFRKRGPFSKSEYVAGYAPGWNYELSPDYAEAEVDATGTNPTTEDTHSTTAFAPTEVTAVEIIIACDICNDAGCEVCDPYR